MPPGRAFENNRLQVCGVAVLRFVVFSGFMLVWLDGFRKEVLTNKCMNADQKYAQIIWNIFEHPSKIDSKSIQYQLKTTPLDFLWRKNAPRLALGRTPSLEANRLWNLLTRSTSALEPFWPKMKLQGWIFGPLEIRISAPKLIFEDRLVRGPSKNGLWKGGGINMKI